MQLALDTNAYTDFVHGGDARIKSLFDEAGLIVVPFIVDAELRSGFKHGTKEADNRAKLAKFQSSDKVTVLWPDAETNETYAKIWTELAAKGRLIPTNDIWIAAICLQHNLTLITSDSHFSQVPLLQVSSVR